jgi:hypothetical protein
MRYIHSSDITNVNEWLESPDWDIVELGLTINKRHLDDYYRYLTETIPHLKFNFLSSDYLRPEIAEEFKKEGRMGNYIGDVQAWTMSWPVERDIPCPSKTQANIDMYPELVPYINDDDGFMEACKIQNIYKYGLINLLLETITDRALRQSFFTMHPAKVQVVNHVDGPRKKIHLPIITNKDAYFAFGENDERKYNLECGKIYIINPTIPHSTNNQGDTDRIHLLSRVDLDFYPTLFSLTGTID